MTSVLVLHLGVSHTMSTSSPRNTAAAKGRSTSSTPGSTTPTRSGTLLWAPLRRWWWLPLAAGVVAGLLIASLAGAEVGRSTSAVVNVRAASSLPNERLDLINDLSEVLTVSEVADPVAEEAGMGSAELRRAISVARVGSSTLVRITVTADLDEQDRRLLLDNFFETAVDYLQPASPSAAYERAQQAEADAIEAYYAAIETNGGVQPPDELARLEQRIVSATREGDRERVAELQRFLRRVISDNRRFAELTSARDRATESLQAIAEADLLGSARGPVDLELSYLDGSADQVSVTSSLALRRGLAGGAAAAVVVAGLVLLLSRRRRLPGQ